MKSMNQADALNDLGDEQHEAVWLEKVERGHSKTIPLEEALKLAREMREVKR
jgi:hypothetical protein